VLPENQRWRGGNSLCPRPEKPAALLTDVVASGFAT